jgi:hydrogenase maturation protease
MGRSLIVGLGNALQGADGFGPAVIHRLRERTDLPPTTALLDAETDVLNWLDTFAAFERVVLVDAFVGGDGHGGVRIVDEATFSQWKTDSPGSHAVSAVMAVALFRRLYPAASTMIVLVGLDADQVSHDDTIDARFIAAASDAIVRLIGE